jgi:hypothetical protein
MPLKMDITSTGRKGGMVKIERLGAEVLALAVAMGPVTRP